MNEKKKNRGSALKEGLLSAFSFGSRDINLEMLRESNKTPYVYTMKNGEDIFLVAVDKAKQVYYDVSHQCFIPAIEFSTSGLRKLNLDVPSEEVIEYMNLFFAQYDLLDHLERKYVEYLQKVKELLKHVVIFQVQSNVMFEDVNERVCELIDNEKSRDTYLQEYLKRTKQILEYRKKLVGTIEKQEIGTIVYGYQPEPNSNVIYLLDKQSISFPVMSSTEEKTYDLPEYYAVKDSIKPLNQNGLKSIIDVDYFYQQLMEFYSRKLDVYQSANENVETVKRLTKKKN